MKTSQEWVQFDNTLLRATIKSRSEAFDNAIIQSSTESLKKKWIRMKMRWLARNDLFWLTGQLGESFDKIANNPNFYQPFCDEVSLMNQKLVYHKVHKPSIETTGGNPLPITEMILPEEAVMGDYEAEMEKIQRLYLCFRTFWKSSIVTKLHSVQLVLNYPNIHMVLGHNKQETSSDNLESVKNVLRSDPLKTWFSELVPDTKDWGNLAGFSVASRSDLGRSEDTVEAVGVGTEVTGKHWQVAKKNDLVTEASVTTEEQIRKTESWDARFNVGLFDNPQLAIQDYEGTRYHFADLYSKLKGDPKIKLIEIPIEDGNGNPVVSERFTREDIVKVRGNTTAWTFSCQHLLKPEDPDKARFRKDQFMYWNNERPVPTGAKKALFVDPANSRKKNSDFTVMLVVALIGKKRYIVDGLRDKLDPTQRIRRGIELIIRHDLKDAFWEEIGLADDAHYLEEKRRQLGLRFTVHPIKSQTISKHDRINSLISEYDEGWWFWPEKGCVTGRYAFDGRSYDLTEELEVEHLQWPFPLHDDVMDTETFVTRADFTPGVEIEDTSQREQTMEEYIKQSEQNKILRSQDKRNLKRVMVHYR